jgi:hypothetical protein
VTPSETLEKYILENQSFLAYTSNVRLYEDPDAEVIRNIEVVHWLGPPSIIMDDDDGKITNLVSHCLQFHIDVDSSLAQGAQIPGKWSTQGFSATWKKSGDGYNYLIGDFSDVTQFRFSDEGRDGLIPYSGWETSDKTGSGGLVDSGTLSFADTDNLLVAKLAKNLGSEPTPDSFAIKYRAVYEDEHGALEDGLDDDSSNGGFNQRSAGSFAAAGMMVMLTSIASV